MKQDITLAQATYRFARMLAKSSAPALLTSTAEGTALLAALAPHIKEHKLAALPPALGPFTSEDVREYYEAQKEMHDNRTALLHAQEKKFNSLGRDVRMLTEAVHALRNINLSEVNAYFGNLKGADK